MLALHSDHEEYSTIGENWQCPVQGDGYGMQVLAVRAESSLAVQDRRARVRGAPHTSGKPTIQPLPVIPARSDPPRPASALRWNEEARAWCSHFCPPTELQ
jgi:hypothetical protein